MAYAKTKNLKLPQDIVDSTRCIHIHCGREAEVNDKNNPSSADRLPLVNVSDTECTSLDETAYCNMVMSSVCTDKLEVTTCSNFEIDESCGIIIPAMLDSGASLHLTGNEVLNQYMTKASRVRVSIADNTSIFTSTVGTVPVALSNGARVNIPQVHYCEGMLQTLLSVKQLLADQVIEEIVFTSAGNYMVRQGVKITFSQCNIIYLYIPYFKHHAYSSTKSASVPLVSLNTRKFGIGEKFKTHYTYFDLKNFPKGPPADGYCHGKIIAFAKTTKKDTGHRYKVKYSDGYRCTMREADMLQPDETEDLSNIDTTAPSYVGLPSEISNLEASCLPVTSIPNADNNDNLELSDPPISTNTSSGIKVTDSVITPVLNGITVDPIIRNSIVSNTEVPAD
jgi:hypothetical protein